MKKSCKILTIDGQKIRTLSNLYKFLAKELFFPDYFGNNFDALVDCLGDLHMKVMIYIKNPKSFLSSENMEDKSVIDKIFENAQIPVKRL